MLIIKCIIIFAMLAVVPLLLGALATHGDSAGGGCPLAVKFLAGLFASWALFWVLCVPMAFLRVSFTALTALYSGCIAILCGVAIWVCFRGRPVHGILSGLWKARPFSRFERVYFIMLMALLGIQLYYALFYDATIWTYDDYEYVVRSQDTISSGHMSLTDVVTGNETGFSYKRVLNSWDIYIAYLSRISGFQVTTMAHTVIPVVLLLVAWCAYYYMATRLFEQRENRLIFLCVLSVALMFGLYSQYSLTFRLLVALWQGKAVLSAIVVPFLIAFLPDVYTQKGYGRAYVYLTLTSMAACSLTMMGPGMVIAVYVGMAAAISLCRRKPVGIKHCFCGCLVPTAQIAVYLLMR